MNIPSAAVETVAERRRRASLRRGRRRCRSPLAGSRGEGQGDQSQSDLDRADLDHQERDHSENAEGSGLARQVENPHPRQQGSGGERLGHQLEHREGRELHAAAGFRRHNSLGSIRIGMPNKHAVYMHDTPSKSFFARADRFLSHGCVRVQGVYDLAAWLLRRHARRRTALPGTRSRWPRHRARAT